MNQRSFLPPEPKNDLQAKVFTHCKRFNIPLPEVEVRFCQERMWRLDFAWPDFMVALEVDGGVFMRGGGGHNRGGQIMRDYEKRNMCTVLGWRLIQMTTEQIDWGRGDYFAQVMRCMLDRGGNPSKLAHIQTKPVPKKKKGTKKANPTMAAPF